MNKSKQTFLRNTGTFLVLFILLVVCVHLVITPIISKIDKADKGMSKLIGEQVVLRGDTLMIVDYSLLNESVTLENNVEINIGLLIDVMVFSDEHN